MQPSDLGILLHQAVESRLGRIVQLTTSQGWLEDVETVHDVRVASRRLRAALELAGTDRLPVYRRLRKKAKALTAALGTTRELDVHVERLGRLSAGIAGQFGHAVLEHVLEVFDQERKRARGRMAQAVARAGLQGWGPMAEGAGLPAGPTEALPISLPGLLEPRLRAALDGCQERVLRQENETLHRLRIETKKLRYALETLAPALPPVVDTWLGRLKLLQGALGDFHDWAVLEAELWIRHTRLVERGRAALAAGTLDLLGTVVEQRQAAFLGLPGAAAGLDPDQVLRDLCPGTVAP